MSNTLETQKKLTMYLSLKEFSFGWLDKNRDATKQDLMAVLLPTQAGLAQGTANAQYVADRVFKEVEDTKKSCQLKVQANCPEAKSKTLRPHVF